MNPNFQEVFTKNKEIKLDGKKTVSIDLFYRTSDDNNNVEGLVLNIHYEPSKLTILNITDNSPSMLSCNTIKNIINDPNDENYKIVKIAWGDIFAKWPGKKLPINIASLTFNVETLSESIIKFTEQECAPRYRFKQNNLKLIK